MAAATRNRENSILMQTQKAFKTINLWDADGTPVWDGEKLLVEDMGVATGELFHPEETEEDEGLEERERYAEADFESKHPRHDDGRFKDVEDIGELEHVAKLGGTTGAALYRHKKTNKHYVVKGGGKGGAERVQSEILADSIYQLLGARVPNSGIISSDEGPKKIAEALSSQGQPVANLKQWLDSNKGPGKAGKRLALKKELARHFVADCLLANWDVVGLDLDNVLVAMHDDGTEYPYRIDNGGALRFRAQGGLKGSSFGSDVDELTSMMDPIKNKSSASVFQGNVTGEEVIEQIQNVLHRRNEIFDLAAKIEPKSADMLAQRMGFLEDLLHTLAEHKGEDTIKYGLKSRIKLARKNTDPDPTHPQKLAGNYRKGTVPIRGLTICIETPKGKWREWANALGARQKMTADYGYIKSSRKEADGGKVDVFIGPDPKSDVVYIVDQTKKDGSFDEHKVLIGWYCEKEAREGYLSNYKKGWTGLGSITQMTFDQFKRWLAKGSMRRAVKEQKEFYSLSEGPQLFDGEWF